MIECFLRHTSGDLKLPISSLSSRMKPQPVVSSLSVTVPNGLKYITEINNRLVDGYVEVLYNGQLLAISDTIDTAPLHNGPMSSSVQLSCSGLFPVGVSSHIVLPYVNYTKLNVDGSFRIRTGLSYAIQPGDTAEYKGITYNVDEVVCSANETNSSMEIVTYA